MNPLRLCLATAAAVALLGCAQTGPASGPAEPQRQALLSHHWLLQQALTPQGSADPRWAAPAQGQPRALQLDFGADQMLLVQRLCNSMRGSYSVQGGSMQVGRLSSTMMACSDAGLMQLEDHVGRQLPQLRGWHIEEAPRPLLQLRFEDGSRWTLAGERTHESRYGAAQRVFLEVAPQRVACAHPLQPQAQCLQVRELRYDEAGIRRDAGPWQNYHGHIEGYTHRPGVREVLRIQRYTRTDAPADASRFVDLLDLRVESERVR